MVDDENRQKENERLALSRQWEMNRCLLETQRLRDMEKSRRQKSMNEKKRFREQLDAKCVSMRARHNRREICFHYI